MQAQITAILERLDKALEFVTWIDRSTLSYDDDWYVICAKHELSSAITELKELEESDED